MEIANNDDGTTNTQSRKNIEKLVSTINRPGIEISEKRHYENQCTCATTKVAIIYSLTSQQEKKI